MSGKLGHTKINLTVIVVGACVIFGGLFTRLLWLSHPDEVVFDEVHFGKFTRWYLRREYFFDIHPALGKFFILMAGMFSGFPDTFLFDNIGDKMPPHNAHWWLRLMPALFGGMLPFVAYLTSYHVTGSVAAAALSASIVLFDNAFLCETRLILTDAFLFMFIALALYFNYRLFHEPNWTPKRIVWLVLSGLFLGAAPSVKWTGLSVTGLCGLGHVSVVLEQLWGAVRSKDARMKKVVRVVRDAAITGAVLVALLLFVYCGSWWIHFHWANRQGDNWYAHERLPPADEIAKMPAEKRPTFWSKFFDLHKTMLDINSGMDAKHSHCSSWLSWPLMERGVAFWSKGDKHIYMIGNALVWWGTTGILAVFILDLLRIAGKSTPSDEDAAYVRNGRFLLLGYLLNLVPYVKVTRCAYAYHYLPSLYYAAVLSGVVLSYWLRAARYRAVAAAVLICVAAWGFQYWAPFTYGLDLPRAEHDARMWSKEWA